MPLKHATGRLRAASKKPTQDASADANISSLRKSGIPLIGDVPWGTHICAFHETATDLLDVAADYFQAGLENNENCIWAVSAPISMEDAQHALQQAIPKYSRYLAQGRIEILDGREWYLDGSRFDLRRITGGWNNKVFAAREAGRDGLRVSGNAFWIASKLWKKFCEYEQELDRGLTRQRMLVLCTYSLGESSAADVFDVARAHQYTIVRRGREWEFLETRELVEARREVARLTGALDILSTPFPGHDLLTTRERTVLAQIVRGLTNKEAAFALDVSIRTIEFHRAHIMEKLGARNIADLVRKVTRYP